MTERLYLIPGSDCLARFQVARSLDGALVFLHNGSGTISLDPADAVALGYALIAVGRGAFEVAETEVAIRLRQEAADRRRASALAHQPPPLPSPRPTLEQL